MQSYSSLREFYRNELLPDVLMMGLTEEQFWKSNPRTLAPYAVVYERRQFEIDRICHRMGAYVYEAVGSALSSMGKKSHPYRDKPYMAEAEEERRIERMTKEEQLERVEQIFKMLDSVNQR